MIWDFASHAYHHLMVVVIGADKQCNVLVNAHILTKLQVLLHVNSKLIWSIVDFMYLLIKIKADA